MRQLKGQVRLVSITFDPETDTPKVLAAHAARLKADPAVWTFLTGDRVTVHRFAGRFGVGVIRPEGVKEINHNLRTALDRPRRPSSQVLLRKRLDAQRRAGRPAIGGLRRPDGAAEFQTLRFSTAERHIIRRHRSPLRRAGVPERPPLQHGTAARSGHLALIPRRGPSPDGQLHRVCDHGRGDPRTARVSAARDEPRVDRRPGPRALHLQGARPLGFGGSFARPRSARQETGVSNTEGVGLELCRALRGPDRRREGCTAAVDLRVLGNYDWRLATNNVWKVERLLFEIPHRPIRTSPERLRRLRKRYVAYLESHEGRKPVYYDRRTWTPIPEVFEHV